MVDLSGLLDAALEAAWGAGRLTLGYFQTGIRPERKADDSPVTRADKEAEAYLRKRLNERYPDHGIIGEEYGTEGEDRPLTWIIDPIDGTKSFMSGVPLYSNLIALYDREREHVLVGVAHFPALGETVYAARGLGTHWNGRRARVSSIDRLDDALVLTSELSDVGTKNAALERMLKSGYFRRTWGDSYGYALVATGRAEVMFDPVMNIWDSAPFGVILPEAGGTFTDWKGNATIRSVETVATNGRLLAAALSVLRG